MLFTLWRRLNIRVIQMALDVRPNLIIAGAQKAGTTTLATRLACHPEIFMPPEKELNFFTKKKWYMEIDAYLNRYAKGGNATYRLDATPGYLWTDREKGHSGGTSGNQKPPIAESIRSLLGPRTKILIILRHPTLRTISAFFHQFRMGRIGTQDRIRNIAGKFGLVDIGFYSEHIAKYRKVFPHENIRVYFLENYSPNKDATDREIYQWLGLDPRAVNASKAAGRSEDRNVNFDIVHLDGRLTFEGGIDQVRRLRAINGRYKKMLDVEPPIVETADIDFLNSLYADEVATMHKLFPESIDTWRFNPGFEDYIGTTRHIDLDPLR